MSEYRRLAHPNGYNAETYAPISRLEPDVDDEDTDSLGEFNWESFYEGSAQKPEVNAKLAKHYQLVEGSLDNK